VPEKQKNICMEKKKKILNQGKLLFTLSGKVKFYLHKTRKTWEALNLKSKNL